MAKFIRTPDQIAKDQRAAEMRSRSMTYQQIGDALGVSRQAAHQAVQRAISEIPREAAEEVLRLELEKLDFLERKLFVIMQKEHLRVGNSGKVVTYEGELVLDDGPVMQAIQGLLRVAERRSKLLGINAPEKHEVITLDAVQAEIRRLEAKLGESNDDGLGETPAITQA
jgi:hypothetical protein